MVRFTLYSRTYCHLCDDMLQALQRFGSEFAFTVDVVDVDADERLIAMYDELVPVLLGRRGDEVGAAESAESCIELCHYFLDEARVRAFLAGD